jgi:hypothetical protein
MVGRVRHVGFSMLLCRSAADGGIIQCPKQKGEETRLVKAVEHLFKTADCFIYFSLQGRSTVFSFRCNVPLRRIAIITPQPSKRRWVIKCLRPALPLPGWVARPNLWSWRAKPRSLLQSILSSFESTSLLMASPARMQFSFALGRLQEYLVDEGG